MDLQGEYWTTKELIALGMSRRQIERAVGEKELHRVGRGIFARVEPGGLDLLRALHHRYPGLVFSGHTAVSLYGHRDTVMRPVQAIVPKGHRLPKSPLVKARQSRMGNVCEVEGLPVVSAAAAVAGDTYLNRVGRLRALEQLYSGFTGRERFDADWEELPLALREELDPLLKKCVIGASSQMERFFHLDLRSRGIETVANFKLGPYTWDIGVEDGTAVIDLDSFFFHNGRNSRTFIIDRWKANHAEMMGWGHLQFTDACLQDPRAKKAAIAEIERLLAHRRRTGPGAPVLGCVEVGAWEIHDHLRND